MAVDTSIAVSIKDNFSSGIAKMKKSTSDFKKEITDTSTRIDQLNRKKASIAVDVQKAKKELQEARKAMDETDESAKRLSQAEYNYANLTSELKAVTTEANSATRALSSLRDQQIKSENRAGGSGIASNTESSIISRLGQAGATQMIGDVISQAAGAYINSAFGGETANVLTSALSGAASGAAIGTAISPGIGTAIGAAGGALLGGVSGAIGNFSNRDEYFKSLVQDRYDQYNEELTTALTSGSSTASSIEQSLLQFSTLLGSMDAAQNWVSWMQQYGAETPFQFSDLASMSRVGLAYGFNTDELQNIMQAVGDAGSALGIEGYDLQEIVTYLGRMNSSGKVTLEYLNPLIERGIPAIDYLVDALSEAQGKEFTVSQVYDAISAGMLDGADAARAILGSMAEQYAGNMAAMSETYAGKVSTLEDTQAMLDAAMGEGYNQERIKGIDAQIEYLSGETGKKVEEMYSLIGEYQASLENAKEEALRTAMESVMQTDEYLKAEQEGNGAEMGRLLAEAKAKAEAEYTQTEEYQQYLTAQQGMIEGLQEELSGSYELLGYNLGQSLNKGLKSVEGEIKATVKQMTQIQAETEWYNTMQTLKGGSSSGAVDVWGSSINTGNGTGNAAGLSYVPYNDYVTRLHEGERVLTAAENRAYSQGNGGVNVTVGSMTVREEADIDKIAAKLADEIEQRRRLAWQ